MVDKNCEKCNVKMFDVFSFRKYCPNCKVIADKERKALHYKNNQKRYKELGAKWTEENKEHYLAKRQEYYQKNIESIREKDRLRRNGSEKEKRKVRKKEYYAKNKEIILEKEAKRYQEKKDYIKTRVRQYNKANPDKVRQWSREDRIRRKNAFGTHNVKEFYILCEKFGWKCSYCDMEVDKKTVTVDHFIPTSKGGSDSIENIVPSCKSCNSSKQDKDFFDWYRKQKFYNLEKEKFILKRSNDMPQLTLF